MAIFAHARNGLFHGRPVAVCNNPVEITCSVVKEGRVVQSPFLQCVLEHKQPSCLEPQARTGHEIQVVCLIFWN